MNYTLIEERVENKRPVRLYRNAQGTEVKTSLIYTMEDGSKWWGFVDLHKIPYIRIAYSKHIAKLFELGVTQKDLMEWFKELKGLAKADEADKYEKVFAWALEKEKIVSAVGDPLKQHLALCTVYVCQDEERIDYFDENISELKMKLWQGEPAAIAFFLNWHNAHIQVYINRLEKISKTVSLMETLKDPRKP